MAKHTRKAIITSFWVLLSKKTLDKITVKDIIETAEINRNTFYYHFKDIYELLETAFQEESARFREETNKTNSFYEEYVRASDIFEQYRDAVIHIYNSKHREILNRYLKEAAENFVARFVRKAAEGTGISEDGISYIIDFYSCAIVGSTMQWVEQGLHDYNRDLLRNISNTFEATVDVVIRDYIEHHEKNSV